jgi:hypothetical protein
LIVRTRQKQAWRVSDEDLPHPVDAHVGEPGGGRNDAGVGDDCRQRSERFGRGVEYCGRIGLDGDITLQGDRAAATLGDRLDDGVG